MAWVNPDTHTANGWTDPANAYDDNTSSYAYITPPKDGWSGYLVLTLNTPISCDKVRAWLNRSGPQVTTFEIDVYYSSAWNNIYSGMPTLGQFVEFPIGSTETVSDMRIRAYKSGGAPKDAQVYEADFNEAPSGPTPNAFNKIIYTSEPPTPNAWNQVKQDTGTGWVKILYEGE